MTSEQIKGILNIIEKDYIDPAIKTKRKEILASEEFAKLSAEYLASDEFKERLLVAETGYKNDLELRKCYLKIQKIGGELIQDEWGDVPWQLNVTEESIKNVYDTNVKDINRIDWYILNKLNVQHSDWDIRDNIKQDISARLALLQAGDFDTIITAMLPYVNVDKYIYKS
jgi:hypothetical protein